MSTINKFMKKYNLKNEATSGKKIVEVANKLGLKDFSIYIRTDELTTKQGIINLTDDYKNGTHFVAFKDYYYFDSFCTEPPREIANQLANRNPEKACECYISSNSIQKLSDSNCASYCLYFLENMNQGNNFTRTIMKIVTNM